MLTVAVNARRNESPVISDPSQRGWFGRRDHRGQWPLDAAPVL